MRFTGLAGIAQCALYVLCWRTTPGWSVLLCGAGLVLVLVADFVHPIGYYPD